jgi:hypothetical protein
VQPDVFITIAFGSFVVALAIAGLVFALHERRRDAVGSRTPAGPRACGRRE